MSSISNDTRRAEDDYESQNDQTSGDAPSGNATDNDYISRPGQSEIKVQKDEADVEEPYSDPSVANSEGQLQRDDAEAIDQSNIMDERTRGATKSAGTYTEPGDEEGLPANDGTSAVAQ